MLTLKAIASMSKITENLPLSLLTAKSTHQTFQNRKASQIIPQLISIPKNQSEEIL